MLETYNSMQNILTSFIRNEPPVLSKGINYPILYDIAKTQHIDGIIGFVLSTHNLLSATPIAQKLLDSYISAITVNTNQTIKFESLAKHLIKNNIDLAVFKGYSIRKIYPVPELRSFSDIDILIKKSDRKKCHSLMIDSGFTCEVDYGNTYSYRKGLEYYEFHTSLIGTDILENETINDYLEKAWHHTHKTDIDINEFDDEFHLIYLIAHIAKHIHYGGAGIRMYLDIALFVENKTDFDYNHFIQTTEILEIDKFSCTVINAACTWFSIDIPLSVKNKYEIDNDTLTELFSFTINKGLFGNAMESSGEATVQLMKKQGSKHPKTDALLSIAFPPLKTMKLKHRYLDKAPFLLPIAWIQRAILNIAKLKSKRKKIEDIISTDKEIIDKHQELLKNIGLQKPKQ